MSFEAMDKIIKITDHVENIGTLKADGNGSVHKGRRIGEIFTAVKLLPFPVQHESLRDKNLVSFQNEVLRLKKVNNDPNPHVVRILYSGITETGNFPFIEMEFVEGLNLEELQKSLYDPIFPIHEVIKVAEHLSSALAHWHRAGVKHGDIKSSNVRFNVHTGNYVLVDFGVPSASQDHHSGSLNHTDGFEFLAPESRRKELLFQTDVYYVGVILFNLVAGNFSVSPGGNEYKTGMVSYAGIPPHEFLSLRKRKLPPTWSEEKRQDEMRVPEWLILMIYQCLEKDPENRFNNGIKLHEYVLHNTSVLKIKKSVGELDNVEHDKNEKTAIEKDELKTSLEKEKYFYKVLHGQWKELNDIIILKDRELQELKQKLNAYEQNDKSSLPLPGSIFNGLLLVIVLSGFIALYLFFSSRDDNKRAPQVSSDTKKDTMIRDYRQMRKQTDLSKRPVIKNEFKKDTVSFLENNKLTTVIEPVKNNKISNSKSGDTIALKQKSSDVLPAKDSTGLGLYKVISKAYFHNQPDENTRRNAFIIHWNNATLNPLEVKDGFIYIVFINHLGQTSKGWLRKKDLNRIEGT